MELSLVFAVLQVLFAQSLPQAIFEFFYVYCCCTNQICSETLSIRGCFREWKHLESSFLHSQVASRHRNLSLRLSVLRQWRHRSNTTIALQLGDGSRWTAALHSHPSVRRWRLWRHHWRRTRCDDSVQSRTLRKGSWESVHACALLTTTLVAALL